MLGFHFVKKRLVVSRSVFIFLFVTLGFAATTAKHTVKPASSKTSTKSAKPATAKGTPEARWMRNMTLRDEVAQLIVVPFSGRPLNTRSKAYRDYVRLIAQDHIGGMILVNVTQGRLVAKAQPLEVAAFLNKMQRLAPVPLLVSADLERGASMRLESTTVFPHAMAFTAGRDTSAARYEGEITAREARAVGIHWVFYPVADVNNNPDNPIINIRSFGESPEDVSAYVTAFIEGAQSDPQNRVLTTAKHFPGHGDTSIDSHLNLPVIPTSRARLEQLEFLPFQAAIRAGVDSIMTAHISVPAIDEESLPATLSPKILTGILREQMQFKGIIVTDALEMGGIVKGFGTGEAAVRALAAGADVLLMPSDPRAAIQAVVAAVRSGKISKQRLDASVMRLLQAKAKLGLATKSVVDLEEINTRVNSPESNARAQNIADHAVTLVKNQGNVVPLAAPTRACYFVLTESPTSVQGQAFQQEVRRRAPGARVSLLDSSMMDAEIRQAEQGNTGCDVNVVAAFVTVAAYRGDVALGGELPGLLNRLTASGQPLVLVSLGNPYLLRNFPKVNAYMATFSTVPPSEIAAVKSLFGEIAIGGKLPVSIPTLATYGEGIQTASTRGTVK